MSTKVIVEERGELGAYRMSAAQYGPATSFAISLPERGVLELNRCEAEFVMKSLRLGLDALPDAVKPSLSAALDGDAEPASAKATPVPLAPRAGKRWEPDEDHRLVAEFKAGKTFKVIAKEFGRTPTAIIERLLHHKLITVSVNDGAHAAENPKTV